jgi:hypothetical protein
MLGEFYGQFREWLDKTKAPPANQEDVAKVLDLLTEVTAWAPEVQRGKRKYSDERFVKSVRKRMDEKGDVSERQLDALVRIACKYNDQLPGVEARLAQMGLNGLIERVLESRPDEKSLRKLEVVEATEMDESTTKFVDSLRQQTDMGRALSDAQIKVLNSILLGAADQIPDFESVCSELGLSAEDVPDDPESGAILEAMEAVTEWNEPVKRGKRTYDDKAFIESLRGYYARKKFLSDRQRGALKRICARYADQVPNFEELAETYGIKRGGGKRKPEGGERKPEGGERKSEGSSQ